MREKRIFEKSERQNPNTVIVYVRKEDTEELAMFDRLILQDPYLLKLKRDGEIKSNRGFRSVIIMRLIKLYNKSHIQREENKDDKS